MNKHGLIFIAILVLILSTFVFACAQPAPATPSKPATPTTTPPAAKTIELNYNKMGPPIQPASQKPAEYLASEVNKRTEGRVKINIFPNSALAAPGETYEALLKGVSDIGETNASYNPGRFPATEISEMPLGYPNSWVGSHALNDWYANFKPKEWQESIPIYFFTTTPYTIGTVNKQVQKLDDLKGMIIRSSGVASDKYVLALGATPRALPVTETYEALSKSMMDGLLMPMEAYPSFKFDEVVKFCTDMSFASYGNCSYVAMNKNSFNKLSEKDQKTILDIGQELIDYRTKMFMEETDKAIKKFMGLPGRQWFNFPPGEQAKVLAAAQTVVDGWVAEKTAKGLPAADYVKYMKERLTYWAGKQSK